jgi:hypothetical protein
VPPSIKSVSQQLNGKDNHGKQEQENGNPVDAMHIFHPLRPWFVGILFPEIEIL